jgi:hypothetical protein
VLSTKNPEFSRAGTSDSALISFVCPQRAPRPYAFRRRAEEVLPARFFFTSIGRRGKSLDDRFTHP